MSSLPLSDGTDSAVENVYIYISDALRYDHLPAEIRSRGVTGRAIAASTFTANSQPSITSGLYPSKHKVWEFEDQHAAPPELFSATDLDVGGMCANMWNELPPEKQPPLRFNYLTEEREIGSMDPPFAYLRHDHGGHTPYLEVDGSWTTKSFFEEYNDPDELREMYATEARRSGRRFLDDLSTLEDRDIIDETLVIFTADHGQALGEEEYGGRWGHGDPMCPAVLDVPVVFIGAGLPHGETIDRLLSLTDIAPTALAAQGRSVPDDVDGVDLWNQSVPEDRRVRSEVWEHRHVDLPLLGELTLHAYKAASLWDSDGGHVVHHPPRSHRLAYTHQSLLRGHPSPVQLHNLEASTYRRFLSLYRADTLTWGDPDFSIATARDELPMEYSEKSGGGRMPTDESVQTQLESLGYL